MANPIRELVIKVTVDADTKGLDKLDEGQAKSKEGSQTLAVALGTLAADLVKVGIAAAKAGAAMLADLVFGTAEAADATAKASKQLNINAEALQRLRGAAALSGADTATMDKGIRILTKGLADAAQKGTGPAAEGLAALGLEVAEIDSLLEKGDIEGAMGAIGDAFNNTADSAQKNAALLKLMGTAGAKLRPLMEEGTEGIKELGGQINSVISTEDLAKFEDMVDAQFLMKDAFDQVKNTIAIGLAPWITQLTERGESWIESNEKFISQDLPRIMEEIGESLLTTGEFLFELLVSWREFIRDTKDLIELLDVSLTPALEGVSEGMASMGNFADGLSLALLDIVEGFLEAIGAGDELLAVLREIRKEVLGDDGPKGQRGAPGFKGGGSALVGQHTLNQAEAAGDSEKLRKIEADPRFSDTDRARVGAVADGIDATKAAKAEKEAADTATEREAEIESSRARTAAARKKTEKRLAALRGGGKGKPKEEISIDDLIGSAIGEATGGPSKVGSDALAGTMLITVNNDNSVTITNGPLTVTVDASTTATVAGGTDLTETMREVATDVLAEQNKMTFDFFTARNAVGGG